MRLKLVDYLLVGLQGVLFVAYLWPVNLNYELPQLPHWPMVLVMIFAAFLIVGALLQLGHTLSPFPKPKSNSKLLSGGVFALVRHPIYSGLILAAGARAIYQQSAYQLILSAVFLLFFFLKSQYEEANMQRQFPEYQDYKKRTGRFFPRLFSTQPK